MEDKSSISEDDFVIVSSSTRTSFRMEEDYVFVYNYNPWYLDDAIDGTAKTQSWCLKLEEPITIRDDILNVYCSDFIEISNKKIFIDKTLMIKEFLMHESKNILISAPEKSGKSTIVNMLHHFLDLDQQPNSLEFFNQKNQDGTYRFNVARSDNWNLIQEKCGKFPVLLINFDYYDLEIVIIETFKRYKFLLNSPRLTDDEKMELQYFYLEDDPNWRRFTKDEIVKSLKILGKYLFKHYGNRNIIVLIDSYDSNLFSDLRNDWLDEITDDVEILNKTISNLLSSSDYIIEKSLIVGRTNFVLQLNDVKVFRYPSVSDDEFEMFFGLTYDNVEKLFEKFNVTGRIREKLKKLFAGYLTSKKIPMYNMFWILMNLYNYINFKKPRICNHNMLCGIFEEFYKIFLNPIIHYKIELLLKNTSITVKVPEEIDFGHFVSLFQTTNKFDDSDVFWLFLLDLGYLTFAYGTEKNVYELKLPNNSTTFEFKSLLSTHYLLNHYNLEYDIVNKCASYLNRFSPQMDKTVFQMFFKNLNKLFKRLDLENFDGRVITMRDLINSIFFSLICRSQYRYDGDLVTFRDGRPELIVHKDDVGMVINYGYSSGAVLSQIVDNEETKVFKRFRNKINYTILMGISISFKREVNISFIVSALGKEEMIDAIHLF